MIPTTVTIRENQKEQIDKQCLNLSKFVRIKLDEYFGL